MLIKIKFAENEDKTKVLDFFKKNILEDHSSVNFEFLCPFGALAAISRGQVVMMTCGDKMIGGLRFYPRKRDSIVSLYQFAIDENFRSRGLLLQMLRFTGFSLFEASCFPDSTLNDYFRKKGWEITKTDNRNNYWSLKIAG